MATVNLLFKFAVFTILSVYMISEISAQMWGPPGPGGWWGPNRGWWRYRNPYLMDQELYWRELYGVRPWDMREPWGPPRRGEGNWGGWDNNNQQQWGQGQGGGNQQWGQGQNGGEHQNSGQMGQGFQNPQQPQGPQQPERTTTTTQAPIPSPPGPPGI